VMAATRPAPSLARVVEAPIPVVQLVDRALAFESSKRFQNATEMRAAVQAARQSLSGVPSQPAAAGRRATAVASGVVPVGAAAPPGQPPAAPPEAALHATAAVGPGQPAASGSPSAPAAGVATPTTMVRSKQDDKIILYDASFSTKQNVEDMTELFGQLEKFLHAKRQYGPDHPEVSRRADRLFAHAASALLRTEVALAWNVTPYAFVAGDAVLWEPRAPFDRIPYQLFSDGIRLLALLPGLVDQEWVSLLRMLTLDRATEMAPEDDFVTMLWDACFDHVTYHAIDSFAQGDAAERAEFERMTAEIVKLANFDASFQLEDSWHESRTGHGSKADPERQRDTLVGLLAGDESDTEARARAAAVHEASFAAGATTDTALDVDPATAQVLGTRIDSDTQSTGERFVAVAARTYQTLCQEGNTAVVASPLRGAVDRLAEAKPEMAIAMVLSLANAVREEQLPEDTEFVRGRLVGDLVSPATMRTILKGATKPGSNQQVFASGLERLLAHVDDSHVAVVIDCIPEITDPTITDQLIEYLSRTGRGHEHELGGMFADANVELGLALVRVLAALPTPESRQAISMAAHSPHPVVRIEALGHVEGVSSERLREELRGLIEDHDAAVRLAALRAMEHHSIRVAGPFLVLRIKSEQFDKLPFEERTQALSTLATLAPNRAEPVCVALLQDQRMVSSESHEQSRAAAAEILGRISASKPVVQLLEDASTKRWRSSERVRAAAAKALEQVAARIARTLEPGGGAA